MLSLRPRSEPAKWLFSASCVALGVVLLGCVKKSSRVTSQGSFSGCWSVEKKATEGDDGILVKTDDGFKDLWTAYAYCATGQLGPQYSANLCETTSRPILDDGGGCKGAFSAEYLPRSVSPDRKRSDHTQHVADYRPQVRDPSNELEIFEIPGEKQMRDQGACYEFTWSQGNTTLSVRGPGIENLEKIQSKVCSECALTEMKLTSKAYCGYGATFDGQKIPVADLLRQ
jgi:hypothetical protein